MKGKQGSQKGLAPRERTRNDSAAQPLERAQRASTRQDTSLTHRPPQMEVLTESPIARWSDEDGRLYEEALDALSALMMDCARQIAKTDDPEKIEELEESRETYALRRERLHPGQREAVAEAIAEAQAHFART